MNPVILFADGTPSFGRRARVELRRRGARVLMAASVDEALRLAKEAPPDLLVLDDELPGHAGRDLAELFREKVPGAEIVLLESRAGGSLRGIGLGLLYSGPREMAGPQLVSLAESALGSRLGKGRTDAAPRKRVLCVDDEEGFLKSLARMLTRRGYNVSAFNAAERALEAVDWDRPDVALVDIMMPGMDGLELAEKMRGKVPVVFITGLDTDEVHYEAHQHGARYLVTKSQAPERVLDVVDFLAGDLDEEERGLLDDELRKP